MSTVSTILSEKGTQVWHVSPGEYVYEALRLMAEKDVGALLVLDDGRIAGIFSERDYARRVALEGKSSRVTPVSAIMTDQVLTVGPDETLENCLSLMTSNKIRHLPVMQGEDLRGIISIGDVVKHMLDHQQFVIDQLESYIQGY